jgi:TonB family protein
MNRLQKKCVLASTGVHLLLLLLLLCSGFIAPSPKAGDYHVLDIIPANLIDAPFNNAGAGATVAAPPPPLPPPPLEKMEKPDLKPVAEPNAGRSAKMLGSTQLVTRTAPEGIIGGEDAAARARAVRNILRRLKTGLSSGAGISGGGGTGEAYANYRDVVYTIYNQAWTLPANIAHDDETVIASILIASDGTVLNARIVTPSGDPAADASVQRALERVTFTAPFPKGATDKERTYTINFNTKVKRMLE